MDAETERYIEMWTLIFVIAKFLVMVIGNIFLVRVIGYEYTLAIYGLFATLNSLRS